MRAPAIIVPLLAATCLGACTTADPTSTMASTMTSTPPSPAASTEPTTAPSPAPSPDEVACDDDTRAAMERTIADQQRAFAADDFDTAWRFASPGFRSGVDADGLRAIIERGYQLLTTQVALEFGECSVIGPGTAAIAVTARGNADARFLYILTREGDRWLVDRVSGLRTEDPLTA